MGLQWAVAGVKWVYQRVYQRDFAKTSWMKNLDKKL